MWPPERVHFWPQRHSLNKLGKVPLGDIKYQITRPYGFRQEDFFMFSLYTPM